MRRKKMQVLVIALLAVSLVMAAVSWSEAGYYRRGHWGYHSYYRPYWGGVYLSPFYGYPVGYYPGYAPSYYGGYYRYGYPYPYRPYVNVGAPFYHPFLPGISFHFGF